MTLRNSGRVQTLAGTLLIAIALVLSPPVLLAQSVTLTPQQQTMLNQLPASQRQQVLQALQQYRDQASAPQPDASAPADQSLSADAFASLLAAVQNEEQESVAAPGATIVIDLQPRTDLTGTEQELVQSDAALIRATGSRVYDLDSRAVLRIPGITEISLEGLTADLIRQRLEAEPALDLFDVDVTILRTESIGDDALQAFGYDVFESDSVGMAPETAGPVPVDYVLGPGDSVRVQFFGSVNELHDLEVSRDGVLNLPNLGPVTVAGLPFADFRADIDRRVQETLIGTQISVTMGRLRTIRVFVMGDVNRPGSYVVGSLSTISSAIYRSGGISRIGTLRDIQLKRGGQTVARLDLYDLLLQGDSSDDARLQPGDVVFVPPVGDQVTVSGAVKRPAIYELRGATSVADLIGLAGGLNADADPTGVTVQRIDAQQARRVLSVDLGAGASAATATSGGDLVSIPTILPELESSLRLQGHVYRPGTYSWQPGMRLTDLLPRREELRPGADDQYILIRRTDASRQIQVLSANLAAALAAPGSEADILLQPRDEAHVFDLTFGRQRVIEPILEDLQRQSTIDRPFHEVSVTGEVRAPGVYPLEAAMRVSDLIRAGGNLAEEAYTVRAELVRYEVVGNQRRSTEIIDVDLAAILNGSAAADMRLQEHDNLRISKLPDWDSLWTINLIGEVRFPGEYRIRRNESLGEVIARAGGLTDAAFADGAVFLRESLREREQEQIEILARRLESDLTALSLQGSDDGSASLETGRSLLSQLRDTEAVGRLVIDLQKIVSGDSGADVELRDRDRLLIPKLAQEITVIGETQHNTSHLYQDGVTRDEYIQMSGGLTRRADKKLIYVVRANGAVVANNRSRWFGRQSDVSIRPGDTIVVPLETDRIRPLTLWTNVTQILYQASIAVAAIRTFDN